MPKPIMLMWRIACITSMSDIIQYTFIPLLWFFSSLLLMFCALLLLMHIMATYCFCPIPLSHVEKKDSLHLAGTSKDISCHIFLPYFQQIFSIVCCFLCQLYTLEFSQKVGDIYKIYTYRHLDIYYIYTSINKSKYPDALWWTLMHLDVFSMAQKYVKVCTALCTYIFCTHFITTSVIFSSIILICVM